MIAQIIHEIINSPNFQEGDDWKRCFYNSNDIVVRTGEESLSFFYVENGKLRVTSFVQLEGNKQIQTGISDLLAGDIFGESSIIHKHKRTATVSAITDCCLVEMKGQNLHDFLEANPKIGLSFYKEMYGVEVERLNEANKRVCNLMAWGLKVHDIEKFI